MVAAASTLSLGLLKESLISTATFNCDFHPFNIICLAKRVIALRIRLSEASIKFFPILLTEFGSKGINDDIDGPATSFKGQNFAHKFIWRGFRLGRVWLGKNRKNLTRNSYRVQHFFWAYPQLR